MKKPYLKELLTMSKIFANVQKGIKSNPGVLPKIEPGLKNLSETININLLNITSDDVALPGPTNAAEIPAIKMDKPKAKRELVDNITDLIKTFEDALAYKGETLEEFKHRTQFDEPHEVAYKRCCVIVFALNQGRLVVFDGDTTFYRIWFRIVKDASSPSGFGFSCDVWSYSITDAYVGARLCFFDPNVAEYAGTQFLHEFTPFLNGY